MTIYENGKIYKIEVISGGDVGDVYYGSTTKKLLSQRMSHHRCLYRKWKSEGKGNQITSYQLFDKYGLENCEIVLVENVENCKSKNELHAREAFYIKNNVCVNKCIPLRSNKEYYEDNKEVIAEYGKKNYELNKDTINKRNKIYREEHKDELKLYKQHYQQENKEKLQEYIHQYMKTNAEKIKEYERKRHEESKQNRIDCDCGGFYHSRTKTIHFKTKIHQAFLCHNV